MTMTKKIDENIEKLKKEVEEWKSKYLRALADYQNLEKRVAQDRSELTTRLEEELIRKLLPIVDVFDEMLKHNPYKEDQGLKSIRMQINDVLVGYGVTHKPIVGKPFDAHYMECVDIKEVKDDKHDNQVLEEVVKVYFNREDKVLRPAKVVVGKKEINQKAEELAKQELQKGDYM